ncbi:hypothetical protein KXW15_001018 [Aspergillus fumigatus]|nr:hypothetical protein KXW15_001018 [Aspergillus fumigatus]
MASHQLVQLGNEIKMLDSRGSEGGGTPSPTLHTPSSVETASLCRENAPSIERRQKEAIIGASIKTILECLGEDPNREGLLQTPKRYARAMLFFTQGYAIDARGVVNDAIFTVDTRELVLIRDIELFSLCEFPPPPPAPSSAAALNLTARAPCKIHIGYVPDGRVLGLSKLARIAEVYSRRLQVQERLTQEIADAINRVLAPTGVVVLIESTHLCMSMRGVQKSGATTITSCMTGVLEHDPKLRNHAEFLLRIR